MGAYGNEINLPYSYGGGSSIIPDYWADKLGKIVQTYTAWGRFTTPVVVDVPLMQKGMGKTVNWSHTDEIPVLDGGTGIGTLASGTSIGFGTNALINHTASIVEFGRAVGLEGFALWLSDPAYRAFAESPQAKQGYDGMNTLMTYGAKTWDRYVGAQAAGANVYFTPRSGSTWVFGTVGGYGTGANVAMTIEVLSGLRAELGQKGIAPRADLNETYAMVAPPGAFRFLTNTDGVQRDAASLGLDDVYRKGFVAQYGGFTFFEEFGLNPVSSYSGSAGGVAYCLGENCLAANTNMGEEENFLVWYPDVGNDSGRQKKMNLYFLGIASRMLPTATTETTLERARIVKVVYKM